MASHPLAIVRPGLRTTTCDSARRLHGKVLHHCRFADACIAPYFHIATAIQRIVNRSDAFVSREHDAAHAVVDIGKRVPGCFRQLCKRRKVVTIGSEPKRLLHEFISQLVPPAVPSRRRDLDREFCKFVPQIPGTRRILGMQRANSALSCQFSRSGARGGEVEDQNVQPAQELPNGLVVVRGARVLQVGAECIDETAHPVVG